MSKSKKSRPRPANGKRGGAATMKNPKPWGVIIASVLTVLFGVSVIGYALSVTAGRIEPGDEIAGVEHVEAASRNHVPGEVTYEQAPPVGGDHSDQWADCTGTVYSAPIQDENALHSLEHGAAWITYNPDLPAEQLEALTNLVSGNAHTMLSPYEGLEVPVSLQTWASQLKLETYDLQKVKDFVRAYKNGPETPEPGASCSNPAFPGAV